MIDVPQIVKETGVSADYYNEYWGKTSKFARGGIELVAEGFREYPIKKYEDRYPTPPFQNVVNETNRVQVLRLDEIAEDANKRMTNPANFTEQDFKLLINEVNRLIRGENVTLFTE